MINVPEEYIIAKFFQFAGYAKYKRLANVYEGGCPTCREGNSWGRKRRLFYLPKKKIICCHNCGWYGNPYKWIKHVSGNNDIDIINEIKNFNFEPAKLYKEEEKKPVVVQSSTLS